MRDKTYKSIIEPLPRSVLSLLHEPLIDPKDGHGAHSAHDIIVLRQWELAKNGDDRALILLVKPILRENLAELKAARNSRQLVSIGHGYLPIRSLVPVMALLRLGTIETVNVPPELDGFVEVTKRKKIVLEDWFEDYALNREGLDPQTVAEVREWIARGCIQRPFRGDDCD